VLPVRQGKNQWLNDQSRRGRVRSKSVEGGDRRGTDGDAKRTASRSSRGNDSPKTSPRDPRDLPEDSLLALAANARPKQPESVNRVSGGLSIAGLDINFLNH
jgi:hypothetical protein